MRLDRDVRVAVQRDVRALVDIGEVVEHSHVDRQRPSHADVGGAADARGRGRAETARVGCQNLHLERAGRDVSRARDVGEVIAYAHTDGHADPNAVGRTARVAGELAVGAQKHHVGRRGRDGHPPGACVDRAVADIGRGVTGVGADTDRSSYLDAGAAIAGVRRTGVVVREGRLALVGATPAGSGATGRRLGGSRDRAVG